MSKAKTFLKNSGIYFTGQVLTILVTIFLLPLFTNYVLPSDYGNYELIKSFADLLIPFLCTECWKAIFRLSFLPKYKENKEKLFSTCLCSCLISDILIAVLMFLISSFYQISPYLPIILVFSETINFIFQYIARSLNKNLIYSISGIAGSLVNFSVGLLCIFVFKEYKNAMLIALISSQIIQALIIFIFVKGWKYFNFKNVSKIAFKDIIKFGWPFGLTTIVYYFGNGFNNVLIKSFLENGADKVALFTIGLKFIAVVTVIASVVEMSCADILYGITDEQERRQTILKWTRFSFKVFVVGGLLFLFVIKLVFPIIIGNDYLDAWTLIPILYVSTFFIMANDVLLNPVMSENKPVINLISKAVCGLINVVLFFALFRYLDIKAACIGYSAGLICEFITFEILNTKILKLKLPFAPAIIFVILYIIYAYCIFKFSLAFNATLFVILIIFGYFYLRKDIVSFLSYKLPILRKKIDIPKPLFIFCFFQSAAYLISFWSIYFMLRFPNTILTISLITVDSLLVILIPLVSMKLKITVKLRYKTFFAILLFSLFLNGLLVLIITEFVSLTFNSNGGFYIFGIYFFANLVLMELVLEDIINEKKVEKN